MNGIISPRQRQALKMKLMQQYEERIDEVLLGVDACEMAEVENVVQAWTHEQGRRTLQRIATALTPHYPPTNTAMLLWTTRPVSAAAYRPGAHEPGNGDV